MGLTVKESGGGSFKQAPTVSHVARCIQIIDLGTQANEKYPENGPKHQLLMIWELPNEMLEIDGLEKPFTISTFYTASLHEKSNLRHDLEAWRGREFTADELAGVDLRNVLTKPCMLSIVEKNGRSKVSSVSSVPKGMEVPPQFNQEVFFSLEEYSQAQFDALPEGIQKMIMRSPEYERAVGGVQESSVMDMTDDIPF
jgi:hypothetical protein